MSKSVVTTSDVRSANMLKVYLALRDRGSLTKRALAQETDLTFASVSSICNQLLTLELITLEEKSISTGGRKAAMFSFSSNYAYFLVVDLHHTEFLTIGLVNLSKEVVRSYRVDFPKESTLEDLLVIIDEGYVQLKQGMHGRVLCLLVCVSAVYNQQTKMILQSSNPILERVNLAMHLREHFPSIPILIENDANLVAYSQNEPCNSNNNHLLFVFFTQGIGLGIIIDGKLYRGANGFAGELGHLQVSGVDTVCDKCGQVGCLRTVAPLASIARDLGEIALLRSLGSQAYCEHLIEQSSVDKVVLERIHLTAEKIGVLLAELFDILNPNQIILGGNNWKLFPMMSQTIKESCRGVSNLAREVDVQISFLHHSCNELIFQGASEKGFRYIIETDTPFENFLTL
ncbi:MAG: ROK family protein [Sphaerochaeta sp.]